MFTFILNMMFTFDDCILRCLHITMCTYDDVRNLNVEGAVPRLSGRARRVWPALLKCVAKQLKSTPC